MKPVGRPASGRLLFIDKDTVDKVAEEKGGLPRVSDMPVDFPVLVVGAGVSSFNVARVGAALRARGVRGYWLVEVQERARAPSGGHLAETLVGFPGLHIERIGSSDEF